MNLPRRLATFAGAAIAGIAVGQTDTNHIVVHVDQPGIKISPMFFGLMTEEINHAYDGGLYGELVQNRSFRDGMTTTPHWSLFESGEGKGSIKLENDSPTNTLLGVTLRLDVTSAGSNGSVGIQNDGFWGIPLKPHTTYKASFYAKADHTLSIDVSLNSTTAKGSDTVAAGHVGNVGTVWRKYSLTLRTGNLTPSVSNVLSLTTKNQGAVWFKDVSLFGPTYHNRPNGNRVDLMELLGDLKPSFLRLPGGNYLEGDTIPERFNWKETIGDTANRPGHRCPWGYRSSDGLGLLEYLEWCEDLNMQPLLAVYAGYSLRQQHVDPGPALQPYVQDALDEIEYVTGSTQTKWGAERAKDGHPKPFPLTYIEVGNEDAFDRSRSYDGRYAQFYDAIKARWPKLQIIATMPVQSRTPDVVDDHYYRSWAEMARDSGHYDRYSRKGPKIFVGEWASIGGNPTPTYREALGDAAWLTGLERDSDLVVMESYAPLLVNVNPRGAQWPTNLIGYDGLSSFGSPSYYVQSLFAKNTGDRFLPSEIRMANRALAPMPSPHGAIGLGTYRSDAEFKDVEVVSGGKTVYANDLGSDSKGWTTTVGTWRTENGAFHQSSGRPDTHAWAGDKSWSNYSYRVKARKKGGAEGFLVLFNVQSDTNYLQWNVGGWGDTRSAIQRHEEGELDELGEGTDTKVETGKWYDVRIDVNGTAIKCYLDGKLITEAAITPVPPITALYTAASSRNGTVYLKVVNVSKDDEKCDIDLSGVSAQGVDVLASEMSGPLTTANTVTNPTAVAPKRIKVDADGTTIHHLFPAYSITVLKIKPRE